MVLYEFRGGAGEAFLHQRHFAARFGWILHKVRLGKKNPLGCKGEDNTCHSFGYEQLGR